MFAPASRLGSAAGADPMETLVMIGLLAAPFVLLGAAVGALIVQIGSDTSRK
jgi:hypothetical protein